MPFYPVDAAVVHLEHEVGDGEAEEADGDGGAVEGDEVGFEDDEGECVEVEIVI